MLDIECWTWSLAANNNKMEADVHSLKGREALQR